MTYIDRSLGEGERIVARAYFHWLYDVASWIALALGIIAGFFVFVTLVNLDQNVRIAAAAVVFAVGLWVFAARMIRKWTTEIGVTSHRFVKKTGWLSLKTNEIALPNIEGVRVIQGIGGRVWGYGQLRIEGTGVDAVMLPPIADPIAFRRAIETAKGIKA